MQLQLAVYLLGYIAGFNKAITLDVCPMHLSSASDINPYYRITAACISFAELFRRIQQVTAATCSIEIGYIAGYNNVMTLDVFPCHIQLLLE